MAPKKKYRYTKQELILRTFAFEENYASYAGRLAKFLNTYMHNNRHADANYIDRKRDLLKRSVDVLVDRMFDGKPPKLKVTLLESLLVGVARNITNTENMSADALRRRYNQVIEDQNFSDIVLREGLSGRSRVIGRLNAATRIFSAE